MLAELSDHTTALHNQSICTVGEKSMKIHRPGHCIFGRKSGLPPESTSYVMHAIYVLLMWIMGKSILDDVNKRFPLMNNSAVSFEMLSSVKSIYNNVDSSVLPVDSSHQVRNKWKTKLLRDSAVGCYWVQLDLKGHIGIRAEHACAVNTFRDWRQCANSMQREATIIGNRGRADYVQKNDVEDLTNEHAGDKIFSLFLNLDLSRVTSIIRLRKRTVKDSTYMQAAQTDAKYKNRRVTR